jgi:SAM-dependent methyltransferase
MFHDQKASSAPSLPAEEEKIIDKVRERYARFAVQGTSCCGSTCSTTRDDVARGLGYGEQDLEAAPDGANLGLGCGAPVPYLELKDGEVVLDLGSGGGFDAFIAAARVGTAGRVIGVDMTPEMVRRAEENARTAGLPQVEFRHGRLERLPVEDATVDAVTSNCVINLVPDKGAVFREVARVLRPGGRLVISDIVLDGELPAGVASDLMAYVGCIAGAMQRESYFDTVRRSGLAEVEVLRDIDFVEATESALPDEVQALAERTGVSPETLRGKVRSVTFRATKPRA